MVDPVRGGANIIAVLGADRYPGFRGVCLRDQGGKFFGAKACGFGTVLLCVIKSGNGSVQRSSSLVYRDLIGLGLCVSRACYCRVKNVPVILRYPFGSLRHLAGVGGLPHIRPGVLRLGYLCRKRARVYRRGASILFRVLKRLDGVVQRGLCGVNGRLIFRGVSGILRRCDCLRKGCHFRGSNPFRSQRNIRRVACLRYARLCVHRGGNRGVQFRFVQVFAAAPAGWRGAGAKRQCEYQRQGSQNRPRPHSRKKPKSSVSCAFLHSKYSP